MRSYLLARASDKGWPVGHGEVGVVPWFESWGCSGKLRGGCLAHCGVVPLRSSATSLCQRMWRAVLRCCAHFQKGCPQTTLSPLKCETPCEIQGAGHLAWACFS